jgi:hypothetical protein
MVSKPLRNQAAAQFGGTQTLHRAFDRRGAMRQPEIMLLAR